MKLTETKLSLILWLIAALILLWGLGCVPLTDVDEGAFAEASREMLSRGDFVSPWLLDAPRFDKPALIHWLQMVAMQIFGINAFSARLPSALAGLLWCWVMVRWAREAAQYVGISANAAQYALLIAVTSIALPVISRVSTADAVLNAFLAVSLYCLWRAMLAEEVAALKKYTRYAAIFIGLGLLTKGPIALLVPAAASFVAVMLRPVLFKNWLKVAFDPIAWLIALAIAIPWYYLQYQAQGMAFIAGFFGKHNLGRYTGTMLGFSGGMWYYPTWMLVSILPWSPMLLRSLISLAKGQNPALRDTRIVFLWAIPLFVLVFFSFSSTKLPHYGFYGLSGLFVLMALTLAQLSAKQQAASLLFDRIFIAILLLVFACTFVWAPKLANLTHDTYYHLVLVSAGELLLKEWYVLTGLSLVGCALLFAPSRFGAWRLCAGAVAFAISLHLVFVPSVISVLRAPIIAAAQQVQSIQTPVVSWHLGSPSLSFNAKRVIPSKDPVLGDTVVLYEKNHAELLDFLKAEKLNATITTLWHEGGVEIIKLD